MLPLPISLSMRISPPCPSTSALAMDNPFEGALCQLIGAQPQVLFERVERIPRLDCIQGQAKDGQGQCQPIYTTRGQAPVTVRPRARKQAQAWQEAPESRPD